MNAAAVTSSHAININGTKSQRKFTTLNIDHFIFFPVLAFVSCHSLIISFQYHACHDFSDHLFAILSLLLMYISSHFTLKSLNNASIVFGSISSSFLCFTTSIEL